MPHSRRLIANTLARTFTIGVAAGLRSQTPTATLALAARDGQLPKRHGPVWDRLDSGAGRRVALIAMVGEILVDKLPFVPARIQNGGQYFRIAAGAGAGALLTAGLGGRSGGIIFGALAGGAGAAVGTYGGYYGRRQVRQALGCPDFPVAVAEDISALALARAAVTTRG